MNHKDFGFLALAFLISALFFFLFKERDVVKPDSLNLLLSLVLGFALVSIVMRRLEWRRMQASQP